MRLAALMSRTSPWSREVAMRLAELGQAVHVIDFARPLPGEEYLSVHDDIQQASVDRLQEMVAGVHLVESRLSSGWRYVTAAPQLKRILEACDAEFLLTLYGGGFAAMAYLSGFRPYSVYVVGSDVLLASGVRRQLGRWALNAARVAWVNGDYLARKTQELAPKANIETLLLGVNTRTFSPGTGIPNRPVRIVCTRGFLPVYNNEYLVRALSLMPASLPEWKVTFASRGPLLEQVRALAVELLPLQFQRNVEFLGGVPPDRLVRELRQAHIYVSLSWSDGTSTSLLEALACGLFPVLSDIPQNREWIDHVAQNGILVPLDQPEVLAESLTRAIRDTELRRRAVVYNRHLALERADSKRNLARLVSHLEAIFDGSR